MITRQDLLKDSDYWFENFQNDLYEQVVAYMRSENINQTELAARLGVSKGYISQILKGNFNHSIKKLIDLSMSLNKVPFVKYKDINEVISDDNKLRELMSSVYEYNDVIPMRFANGERQDKSVVIKYNTLNIKGPVQENSNGKDTKQKIAC